MIMKKMTVVFFAALALALTAFGASFARMRTYEGQFTDVPESSWYASDVAEAYELGFINGKSAAVMDPDGSVTVAEGISMVDRMHAIFFDKALPASGDSDRWYDEYVVFAKENGLIDGETFDGFDRPILRSEMACLITAALPEEQYPAVNDVTSIPDVDPAEPYFDDLMLLYRAGIVMGSDAYGTFLPNTRITRCEAAAVINRAALPEHRLHRTLLPEEEKREAVLLIDDYGLTSSTRGVTRLSSSWNYDDRSSDFVNLGGTTTNVLADTSRTGHMAIDRAFEPRKDGTLTLVTNVTLGVGAQNGARITFSGSDGKDVVNVEATDGVWNVNNVPTGLPAAVGGTGLAIFMDLDDKTGTLKTPDGTASFVFGDFTDFSRLTYATGDEGVFTFTPRSCRLSADYAIDEIFSVGFPQDGWEVDGAKVISTVGVSTYDNHYLIFEGSGSAKRSFSPISGKFVFETYFYLPDEASSASILLSENGKTAASIRLKNETLLADGVQTAFKRNLWNILHVEGDTAEGNATLFLNGKPFGTVGLGTAGFDTLSLICEEPRAAFDNIRLNRAYEYADYCPAPEKVETPDYTLIMSVCSLWHEGSHSGWDFVSPWDETTPLLGYYDEGLPESSDWNVKYMAEHGIDAQQYCWFTPAADNFSEVPIEHPRLYFDLHDGYFYGKYSDDVKFCILWENSNFSSAKMTFDEFKTYLWDYWVEYYFKDPRYLAIDGLAVFEVYRPDYFLTTFRSEARKVMDFMREDIKNYGYEGMIILFSDNAQNDNNASKLNDLGADGLMPYAWMEQSYLPSYLRQVNASALKLTEKMENLTFFPCIANGRSGMGWNNVRNPLSTLEQYDEILKDAKDVLASQNKGKGEPWRKQILYFSTWNEYAEGHWIAPSGLNRFGYADAWIRAFANEDEPHVDIVPTIRQKARIGHLYQAERTPIRREFLEEAPKDTSPQNVVLHFGFDAGTNLTSSWGNFNLETIEINKNTLHLVSAKRDPMIRYRDPMALNAADAPVVRVRMRTDTSSNAQLLFLREGEDSWKDANSVRAHVDPGSTLVDVLFDMTTCANWKGKITSFRFDPIEAAGTVDIESIDFLGYAPDQRTLSVVVDGIDLDIPREYERKTDDELYIAADPSTGIITCLNLYYRWNRWTGELLVKNAADTTVVLTEGSDKALVDGREVPLEKPFGKFDGLPLLPIGWLCEVFGIGCEETDSAYLLSVRGVDFGKLIAERKDYEWDFNIAKDAEGWTSAGSTFAVSGGDAQLTATPASHSKSTGYDPSMTLKNTNFKAAEFVGADIRMAYELLPNTTDYVHDSISFYYATDSEPSMNEAKSVKVKLEDAVPDGEEYFIFHIDFTDQPLWNGLVTSIRFDPTNNNGFYRIDYIHLIPGRNKNAEQEQKPQKYTPRVVPSIIGEDEKPVKALEFEGGDLEALHFYNIDADKITEADGLLTIASVSGNRDPQVYFNIEPPLDDASKYNVIAVRFRKKAQNEGPSELYFKADGADAYSTAMQVSKQLSECAMDEDGFYTVEFDLRINASWRGLVEGLRFDPLNVETAMEIDWIRFYNLGAPAVEDKPADAGPVVELKPRKAQAPEGYDAVAVYDFDDKDELKPFSDGAHGHMEVKDGHVVYSSSDRDPQFVLKEVPASLGDALRFDTVVLRFRMEKPVNIKTTCFFKTDTMTAYDSQHNAVAVMTPQEVDEDGYFNVVLDMTSCDRWEGNITGIRFDPADVESVYYIDSVVFCQRR